MLMAALRMDIPSVHICSGTCSPLISFAESKRLRKAFLEGEISERELAEKNSALYGGPGICPYMGTANTMDIFAEGLGLALSGSATIPSGTSERMRAAYRTGELAVDIALENRKPSQFISKKSFINALTILASVSGSLNHLLHVPAIAKAIDLDIDYDTIAEINARTPQLCTVNPSGPHSIADLHRAGGIPAVINELSSLLDGECINVEGKKFSKIAKEGFNQDYSVIRSIDKPVAEQGGVVILKGNIAREGAAMRISTVPSEMISFTGPAVVFNSEEDAMQALEREEIVDGCVVIVRYEGPVGGPGMREMHRLVGAFSGRQIAVITDGRFSGATGGLSIGYLRPEAALGGEIACVENGDQITIDVTKHAIHVDLTEDEIQQRLKHTSFPPEPQPSRLLSNFKQKIEDQSG